MTLEAARSLARREARRRAVTMVVLESRDVPGHYYAVQLGVYEQRLSFDTEVERWI